MGSIMTEGVRKNKKSCMPFLRQCFITATVAINIIGHGCVIGFSAVLIPNLRKPESYIHPTHGEESWIASVIGFALIIGNLITIPSLDRLGRKKLHLLTIFPTLIGWFLLNMVESVTSLIIVRVMQGVSMGLLGPLGSIIIAEMTDPKNRGAFLTSISLSLTLGVLFSHSIGTLLSWQQTAIVCSSLPFISLVMIIFTPESPTFLIAKGRYDEARQVFFWLRGYSKQKEDELRKMVEARCMIRKRSVAEEYLTTCEKINRNLRYLRNTLKKPEFYKPIVIMLHMYTLFQFAGTNVVSSYATDIIKDVVGPEANRKALMIALDIERLTCNLLTIFLMKSVKRRTLLFSTGGICIISYLSKALYVYGKHNNLLPFDNQWLPISLIGIYMGSATILSSIPLALSGELFALQYKGLGGGISILALSLNLFVAVKCFPLLQMAIGLPWTYCLYGGVVGYCLIVAFMMLPETKDRTLQDIENNFKKITNKDLQSAEPLNGDVESK